MGQSESRNSSVRIALKPGVQFLSFFLLLLAVFALTEHLGFVFDPFYTHIDEGFNLMKALLVERGYHLYLDIWSDQPPVLTFLFALIYKAAGNLVVYYRAAVLFIFLTSVGALSVSMAGRLGLNSAIATVIALGLSSELADYATIAHISTPSIALCLIAVALELQSNRERAIDGWHISACCMFALAIGTKLWVISALAPFVIQIYFDSTASVRLKKSLSAIAFIMVFLALIFLPYAPELGLPISQLISPHLAKPDSSDSYTLFVLAGQGQNTSLLIASCLGAFLLLRTRFILPSLWFLISFLLIAIHTPFRDHYFIMLLVPGALIFGCLLTNLLKLISSRKSNTRLQNGALVLTFLAVGLFLNYYSHGFTEHTNYREKPYRFVSVDPKMTSRLAGLHHTFDFMYCDSPYHAFLLNKPVPPQLAVLSSKRIETKNLSEDSAAQAIRDYQVKALWLSRFRAGFSKRVLDRFGTDHFRLLESTDSDQIYVTQDIH